MRKVNKYKQKVSYLMPMFRNSAVIQSARIICVGDPIIPDSEETADKLGAGPTTLAYDGRMIP